MDWPKNGKYIKFKDLERAVRSAIDHCYNINRKNKDIDVDWIGPPVSDYLTKFHCINFKERLEAYSLDYAKINRGKDAMDEIISIALQLGIEQGRRMFLNELNKNFDDLDKTMGRAFKSIERITTILNKN